MATSKTDDGKSVANNPSYRVSNRANQPREFFIRGGWYRWEPAGRDGSSLILTAEAVASADFTAVAKYFNVAEVK